MKKDKTLPIGMFDSGIGGLSLYKPIKKLLPQEKIIYISDNLYSPYGKLTSEEIKKRSFKIVNQLISLNCKLIVVACNTATTNSITELRKKFEIPFIGIEPGIKTAALKSSSGVVGILATKGTLTSKLFYKTSNLYASHIKIIEKDGSDLVELIEKNKIYESNTIKLLKNYLKPMIKNKADVLVLGCTHFQFLKPIIKPIIKNKMKIYKINTAIAKQTKSILINKNILNSISKKNKNDQFYYTGSNEGLISYLKNPKTKKVTI
ncbi:MAG: glutamate racemase [Flavobacteriaceae bacterium]|nr:glutamate racemase [Flavobacteriaceae bacterium]